MTATAVLAAGLPWASPGEAQSSHATALRVLRGSRDFRARTQAAIALGSSNDRAMVPALIAALSDDSAAVRAAAATGLGRLGDSSAIGPLRRLESDRERVVRDEARRAIQRIELARPARPVVPRRSPRRDPRLPPIAIIPPAEDIVWSRVRYVVVLGSVENRSNFGGERLNSTLHRGIDRSLTVLRGVAVLHPGSEPPDAEHEIRRRRLPKLRMEGSLNRVERRTEPSGLSVRCEVSIMLMDEPGRNIRSVLNGAATAHSPRQGRRDDQEQRLAQQALDGAVRSAMAGAAQAISSAGRR